MSQGKATPLEAPKSVLQIYSEAPGPLLCRLVRTWSQGSKFAIEHGVIAPWNSTAGRDHVFRAVDFLKSFLESSSSSGKTFEFSKFVVLFGLICKFPYIKSQEPNH